MTKGPPQNANCSFWNVLLGYRPTWRWNFLYCFPAAVDLGCYVQLLVHVLKLCSLNLHVYSYLRMCTCEQLAVPPILSPTWRLLRSQSQLWSVHQLTPQALWEESIMSASWSITVSHQQLNRCSQLGGLEGWPGAESKDAPASSLHVGAVIIWIIFSSTTFISFAFSVHKAVLVLTFFLLFFYNFF